jgi:hypothetical protein
MIELGILLGAYKASCTVTYTSVHWIMKTVGFQVVLPLIIIASATLIIYSRSSYIDGSNLGPGQSSIITEEAIMTLSPGGIEGSSNIAPEPSRDAGNPRPDEGNGQPETAPIPEDNKIRERLHRGQTIRVAHS